MVDRFQKGKWHQLQVNSRSYFLFILVGYAKIRMKKINDRDLTDALDWFFLSLHLHQQLIGPQGQHVIVHELLKMKKEKPERL